MRPGPRFLQALGRSRLRIRRARASVGIGERRSRGKGAGIEFADHRLYVPGDDTRHLDARLHARLGEFYVRQYEVLMQLPVAILVDGSRSMAAGTPSKLEMAQWLVGALGYLALSGGDRMQMGFWSGERLEMSPPFAAANRVGRMLEWIEGCRNVGRRPFEDAIDAFSRAVPQGGLAVLLSDWWLEEPERALRPLGARGAEIWAVQVLAPEEIEPDLADKGDTRITDAETGAELLLTLEPALLADYRAALAEWQGRLGRAVEGLGGRYLGVRTDEDPEQVVLHRWRGAEMIG